MEEPFGFLVWFFLLVFWFLGLVFCGWSFWAQHIILVSWHAQQNLVGVQLVRQSRYVITN